MEKVIADLSELPAVSQPDIPLLPKLPEVHRLPLCQRRVGGHSQIDLLLQDLLADCPLRHLDLPHSRRTIDRGPGINVDIAAAHGLQLGYLELHIRVLRLICDDTVGDKLGGGKKIQ